jgi:hypothetical protein
MSLLPMLCWMMLALPGAALIRRRVPLAWGGGLAGWFGIGWMASLVALAPVVVLAYLLRLPTAVVAIVAACFVAWGAIDLARQRVWHDLRGPFTVVAAVIACVIITDAVLAERIGAILDNDARVHLARIRFLVDHGFSNVDPFVRTPSEYPYPLYHTNILHGLHASISWLTGLDPLGVWFGSLGASRLMIAGAAAWTASALVGGRWAPWIAALLAVLSRFTIDYTVYPNQLAPWFAIPMTVGAVAMALARDGRARDAVLACAGCNLVVAMIHPLYAGFVIAMMLPVIGCVLLCRWWRGIGALKTPWACATGLLVAAVPMLVAVKIMTAAPGRADVAPPSPWERLQWRIDGTATADSSAGSGTPDALGRVRTTAIHRQDGFSMSQADGQRFISRDWGRGFTGGLVGVRALRLWTALGATLIALACLGRPQVAVAMGAILVVLGIMSNPMLCTMAIGFLGAQWMILRFEALATILWGAFALPVMAAALERATHRQRIVSLVSGCIVLGAAAWLGIANAGAGTTNRMEQWWHRSMASAGIRSSDTFDGMVEDQRWLRQNIPDGAIVACGRLTGTWTAMLRGSALLSSERSSPGVPAGSTRTRHVNEMLDDRTDDDRRAELFRHYKVSHVLFLGAAPDWCEYWAADVRGGEKRQVIEILDAPDPRKKWERALSDSMRAVLRGCADEAVVALSILVDERPTAWQGWYELGNAYWALGLVDAAECSYLEARRCKPSEPMPELMLGNCADSLGRPTEALARFESAEALAMSDREFGMASSACFNRANVLRRQARLEEAELAYQRATLLNPDHIGARRELGQSEVWKAPRAEFSDRDGADDGAQPGEPRDMDGDVP